MKYQWIDSTLYIDIASIQEKTLQEFLEHYIPSKKTQHLLFQQKKIYIDQRVARRQDLLIGKQLRLLVDQNNSYDAKAEWIIYEDDFCVVVNKEKGLLVHGDGSNQESLSKKLESYFSYPLQAIHRLDKETSGLLFFSKVALFQALFDKMMSAKEIQREYLAIVEGVLAISQGFTIDKAIGKDRHHSQKRRIHPHGQRAITHVRCLGNNGESSVLLCRLETGRTHQIRVHLTSIGHPIMGDSLYHHFDRRGMALFAYKLSFFHPFLQREMSIFAPLGKEYDGLLKECLSKKAINYLFPTK